MWPPIIFGVSFVGIVAFLLLKGLELHGATRTPLRALRSFCDPLLRRGRAYYHAHCRNLFRDSARAIFLALRFGLVRAELFLMALTHRIADRMHQRLRARRQRLRENGTVSKHLKNVLEYKKVRPSGDTQETPPRE